MFKIEHRATWCHTQNLQLSTKERRPITRTFVSAIVMSASGQKRTSAGLFDYLIGADGRAFSRLGRSQLERTALGSDENGLPSVLLIVRPMLRHGPARDRRHPNGRTTKPPREEIPGSVAASAPAAPGIVREC